MKDSNPLPDSLSKAKLTEMVNLTRQRKIQKVIASRTRTIIPVLDQICDVGNISAVLRSAESLGFQSINIIKSPTGYKHSKRTTQGAHKWLDLKSFDTPTEWVAYCKDQKMPIAVTTLEDAVPISDIDFTKPMALVFGNEKQGACPEITSQADIKLKIPMQGFSQSFNISVAVAVALYHIQQDRIKRQGFHGDLTQKEQLALEEQYLLLSSPLASHLSNPLDFLKTPQKFLS